MKFQNSIIDKVALQKTNAIWNQSRVNHPWSIGYTSYLISRSGLSSFDNWISYYFSSGDHRDILIDILNDKADRLLLRQANAPYTSSEKYKPLDSSTKNLNLHYGRSWASVDKRIQFFQKHLRERKLQFSDQDCTKIFVQRVLVDTWNGKVRELNTISQLQSEFQGLEFQESDPWSDFNYGIDYIVSQDERLIAAIQIKPLSYKSRMRYIQSAKKANQKKWNRFEKEKKVGVFLILSDENGKIVEDSGLSNFLKTQE